MFMSAVEDTGPVLLIKGREILGEAFVFGLMPDEVCVQIPQNLFDEHLRPYLSGKVYEAQFYVFRFSPHSGIYESNNIGDLIDEASVDSWFEDVLIVGKFPFEWGFAHPNVFDQIPGYGRLSKRI